MTPALPSFANARLLVAGDVMLDRYWSGITQRISPEAPVPVVRVQKNEYRPGGAANVALNVAALGARVRLLGVVGDDEPSRLLRRELRRRKVEARFVTAPGYPTTTKLRVLSRNQQLIRLDFEETLSPELGATEHAALRREFEEQLREADAVVLSDYGKGCLAPVALLIAAARALRKPVFVDPKGRDYAAYRGATLLTPNIVELELVVGPCPNEACLVEKGQNLRTALNLEALLITRSEKGMTLLLPDRPPLHLPAVAREVFDVTGAGDTVIAVLAAAVAAGQDCVSAAQLANVAAGIVVGKLGTATVSADELRHELDARLHEADGGVIAEPVLLQRVYKARARGARIVMTNGCFDLLHAGHVRYLEAARRLGDLLIVAVNDDASVRRLKGPGRPLNRAADRMAVLASLRCVDWVVPFSEDTPLRLIEQVLPDVLVKGGDYRPEQVAGFEVVRRAGGEVLVLDFHDGYSTTELIRSASRGQRGARAGRSGKRGASRSNGMRSPLAKNETAW